MAAGVERIRLGARLRVTARVEHSGPEKAVALRMASG
jgi:hypothetical protein